MRAGAPGAPISHQWFGGKAGAKEPDQHLQRYVRMRHIMKERENLFCFLYGLAWTMLHFYGTLDFYLHFALMPNPRHQSSFYLPWPWLNSADLLGWCCQQIRLGFAMDCSGLSHLHPIDPYLAMVWYIMTKVCGMWQPSWPLVPSFLLVTGLRGTQGVIMAA